MAGFFLLPFRLFDTCIGLHRAFGFHGTVRRIRNGSLKFSPQGFAFYRKDLDAPVAEPARPTAGNALSGANTTQR